MTSLSQLAVDRLPAHSNDRLPTRVVSSGAQPVQPHDTVFQNGYRTASGAVFLSKPSDVPFSVPPFRSFLRHVPSEQCGAGKMATLRH